MDILELLGLPKATSFGEVERAFERWRTDIEHKISSAPTPALKAKLRKKLREAEEALDNHLSNASADVPGIDPVRRQGHAAPTQPSKKPQSKISTAPVSGTARFFSNSTMVGLLSGVLLPYLSAFVSALLFREIFLTLAAMLAFPAISIVIWIFLKNAFLRPVFFGHFVASIITIILLVYVIDVGIFY